MEDRYFMNLAIKEARKSQDGDGYFVGAVVVINNRIISIEHSNEKKSNGHAEELAIEECHKPLYGATIYTTMEPCSFRHQLGRKSCSDLIIAAGIRRVVYGVRDPDKECNGIEKIKRAGIEVVHLRSLEEICKKVTPTVFPK